METLQEAKWTQAAKDAYYQEHPENFADPKNKAYPIKDASDVGDAWGLAGHADHPDQVRSRIIAIAKRLNLTHGLPDTAQDFQKEDAKESVILPAPSDQSNCIARLKVCWIEDNAISLNGRQYTPQAVDKLIASGQARIADPDGLPLTCYLSHEDAEQDKTLSLVGSVSQLWREGTKGMAFIDVPDTQAGRDLANLAQGKFIRSISLRASNPDMQIGRNSSMPQVVGGTLEGIDFTTSPGLSKVARITDVLRESFQDQNLLIEAFPSLENNMKKLKEDGLEPLASGVTQGVADTTPGDGYANRVMTMPPQFQEPGQEPPQDVADALEAHKTVHDHLANVLDSVVAGIHGKEASQIQAMTEAGRKLAMAHCEKLIKAHDEAAKQCGMSCEGGYEAHLQKSVAQPADDGMQDGDDDDTSENFVLNLIKETQKHEAKKAALKLMQEAPTNAQKAPATLQKEAQKPMTPEEAARLLQEAGYEVKAPKTEEEKFQETLEAKIAERTKAIEAAFEAKLAAMEQKIPQRFTPPQRKSMVEGSTETSQKRNYYKSGDYLKEQLGDINLRKQLLDRSFPWPKEINKEYALNELKKELLGMYDARWGLTGDMDAWI